MNVNLVTVTGHHTHTLRHMLNHYKDLVNDVFVVVYQHSRDDKILEEAKQICDEFGVGIHKTVIEPPFNWNTVTELYNEVKRLRPDDWWIVSDDDEFHLYPKDLHELIEEADDRGYKFITGGFLDRIGEDGNFPTITEYSNVWELFPYAGYFRNPMSGAQMNKCCVMKGNIDVTPGQHFAFIDGEDTWKHRGWKHPLRFPYREAFIQVHHFKWDHTVLQRLTEVSQTITEYSYWQEYKKMYDQILMNGGRIDISNPNFHIERCGKSFHDYSSWNKIRRKIVRL